MLLNMLITLYTSRIVLNALGVEDFGIYNIVGGVVVLFSFFKNAMLSSTQRFLNVELGKGNTERLKLIFSMSLIAHISISILVIILAETIGLWFFNIYLNIPDDKMSIANCIYQISILTTVIQIFSSPYNAVLIAYEKMSFYAYLSIVEVLLKLIVAFLLLYNDENRLVIYSILIFSVTLIVTIISKYYCNKVFFISNFKFVWDKELYMKLMSFSFWSLSGSAAHITSQQGINILLNIFYGITANAALGIANQVTHAVNSFISNFQVAFNPLLMRSYVSEDRNYFNELIFRTSKMSFFMLYILVLPLYVNIEFVLSVWLGNYPDYTADFVKIIMFTLLVDAVNGPLWTSIQATGVIRNYQLAISISTLMTLPISFLLLKFGSSPEYVFIGKLIMGIFSTGIRLYYLKRQIRFPVMSFLKSVLLKLLYVILVSYILVKIIMMNGFICNNWSYFIGSLVFMIIFLLLTMYILGLSRDEQRVICDIIRHKARKI